MARRLTVSIPDALAERLDAYRHILSPSELMQNAITSALDNIDGSGNSQLPVAVRRDIEELVSNRILREASMFINCSGFAPGSESDLGRYTQAQASCRLSTFLLSLIDIASDHAADLQEMVAYAAAHLRALHQGYMESGEGTVPEIAAGMAPLKIGLVPCDKGGETPASAS